MIWRMFTQLLASMREQPDAVRARHLLWFHSLEPATEFHSTLEALHRVQRRQLERWLREGQRAGNIAGDIEPARAAEQLLALSTGLGYQWLVTPQLPLQKVAAELKETLTRWLRPRPFTS
jgi:hypothetical protein